MQVFAPETAQLYLRHLAQSEKSQHAKVRVAATFSTALYVNLVFEAMANLDRGILPGGRSLLNPSIAEMGILTIDFERSSVIKGAPSHTQAKEMRLRFGHFPARFIAFRQTSNFQYEQMSNIVTTLRGWNREMYDEISNYSMGGN